MADQQQVEVDPGSNASSVVLKGEKLNMFSDNPDDLQSELQALAGPSVGLTAGRSSSTASATGSCLPRNPFARSASIRILSRRSSTAWDSDASRFDRPGTNKLRGSANFSFNDGIMNSRNPYSATKPPHQERQFFFNAGGSLNKKTSFNLEAQHRGADDQAFINATGLDSAFKPYRSIRTWQRPMLERDSDRASITRLHRTLPCRGAMCGPATPATTMARAASACFPAR